MAFKDILPALKYSWWDMLSGSLSVPVYKDSVPTSENGNYVLIRGEGSTDILPTNSGYFRSAIIVVDIVTKFPVIGNSADASAISAQINNLILFAPNSYNLSVTDFQITYLTLQSEDELYEDDNSEKVFRIIKRFEHFVNKT